MVNISEDYAKSTGFCVNFTKKKKQTLDGRIVGAWDLRKRDKSSSNMFLWMGYDAAVHPTPSELWGRLILVSEKHIFQKITENFQKSWEIHQNTNDLLRIP